VPLRFSTLVFDLDGTLSDPSVGIARSLNHALARHGFATAPEAQLATEIGPPLDEIFSHLIPAGATETIPALVASYRERYASVGYAENVLYPGIPEALERFAGAGARLGVCTSKLASYSGRILEHFGIREYFSFVDGGDIGIKKGRQLAGLLDRGELDRDAVMIGDRAVDIEAARENALRSVGVLWGFGSAEEIASAEPTHVAETVEALVEMVLAP
jgi:phosphoglycolate phosphatase